MGLVFRLVLAAAIVFTADALVFRTGWYPRLLQPDSSTANIERIIRIEGDKLASAAKARHHVVSVGDSRMGFFVRFANQRWGGEGFRFGSLVLGGSLPRCWPYLLRAVDPDADRYAAVLIPLNDFDDLATEEDLAGRASDLHYLSGQLRVSDLAEFAGSYPDWLDRWTAARAILFKGFAYKRDVQEFIEQPQVRRDKVKLYQEWEQWTYNYEGEARNLVGLEIDRKARTAKYPPGVPDDVRLLIERFLVPPPHPPSAVTTAYRLKWLGKIVDRYRGTKTRLIFLRLARGPIPPDEPLPTPPNLASSVHQFAKEPHVTLIDEHFFDSLEKREFFMDPLHLNRAGFERFSHMLADEVHRILLTSTNGSGGGGAKH